jgi:geranylgeranylglycerol-phosphate geranylgeranyltransferase
MSIPFVFGNVAVAQVLSPLVLVLASLGFVSGLAREILKSVQDMEGDIVARKSRTLPVVIGVGRSLIIVSVLYVLFIFLSFLPFSVGLSLTFFSIGGIAGADLLIVYIIYLLFVHGPDKQVLKDVRNISLAALFIGMIGILIAAI